MSAFYNENDEVAAAVLRECAGSNIIAPGVVSAASIKDLTPDDLHGFTQAHFFAGAGLWSIAARLAGWPDDEPLWSGSCPCQPFSQAGKGAGVDDSRHLWPDFFRLIRGVRPPVVVGEQVAGAAGYGWLDGVRADLEGEGYACRAVDIPAGAVDAPHIRSRIYWVAVADASLRRNDGQRWANGVSRQLIEPIESLSMADAAAPGSGRRGLQRPGESAGALGKRSSSQLARPHDGGMADADGRNASPEWQQRGGEQRRHPQDGNDLGATRDSQRTENDIGLADADSGGRGGRPQDALGGTERRTVAERSDDVEHSASERRGEGRPESIVRSGRPAVAGADVSGVTLGDAFVARLEGHAGDGDGARGWPLPAGSIAAPDGGFWSDHEWLICHDGKARRIPRRPESCVRDVADGISRGFEERDPSRLLVPAFKGRNQAWKIAGNAIVPQLAAEVLKALRDELYNL